MKTDSMKPPFGCDGNVTWKYRKEKFIYLRIKKTAWKALIENTFQNVFCPCSEEVIAGSKHLPFATAHSSVTYITKLAEQSSPNTEWHKHTKSS